MSTYKLSALLQLKDQFSVTINTAKKKFGELNGTFKQNAKEFKDYQQKMKGQLDSFNSGVKKFEMAAVGIGTGAAVAIGSAYKSYMDLNEQLVKNKAISGASEAEFKQLTAQVKNLGATTAFTAKQIAEAQQYQAMAGYDTNKILKTTPELLKLAVATGSDLASTSDMITDSMDAFGLTTNDINRYLDVLTATANNSNTSVAGLGEAYKSAAPQARNWGESLEEVNIMLGLMANSGIKAGMAGTGLGAIYSKLMNPTKDMNEQFGKTKTVLVDANGKMKGLRQILMEAKPALDKMTIAEKNLWMSTIAGTEHIKSLSAIMNASGDSVKTLENKINNSKGTLNSFYEKMKESDKYTFDNMVSAFEALKIQVGDAVSPIMLEGMQKLTDYMKALGNSDTFSTENMRKFFEELKGQIKTAVAAFLGFKVAVLAVRAAMGDPTAIAALGVAALGGALYLGKQTGEDLVKGYKFYQDTGKHATSQQEIDDYMKEREKVKGFKAQERGNITSPNSVMFQKPQPIINITGNNTFNYDTDIEKFTQTIADRLLATQ